MYGPYLTMAEIKAKYPNALVLLANPTTRGRSLAPTGGCVILHATSRAEFDRQFDEWPDDPAVEHFAIWYTGNPGGRFGDVIPGSEVTEPRAV